MAGPGLVLGLPLMYLKVWLGGKEGLHLCLCVLRDWPGLMLCAWCHFLLPLLSWPLALTAVLSVAEGTCQVAEETSAELAPTTDRGARCGGGNLC